MVIGGADSSPVGGQAAKLDPVPPTSLPRVPSDPGRPPLPAAAAGRLYVSVAPDGWKARHIAADGRVAATVPVRPGGILSLVAPIPPATISFHGTAVVHPAGSPEVGALSEALGSLLPAERRASASIVEVAPQGAFLTYGVGVPLLKMRTPATARARVPVALARG